MNSNQILDREFLEMRAKILEIAAALDRIDRGEGNVQGDARMHLIADAIEVIGASPAGAARAEKIQLLFSREYDSKWQEAFAIATRV